ncbi:ALF repeat-containing protein [Streptomyces sp. AM8-1-1]|uniref:ALF repeat-containing protein n=1 Tax=Streptomyces sp. AM8-1-1 TaxID=3075825 RepID=UPI0028C50A14|nr:ALF repeat-containing protein [Streptomyces sp. AM8-1-1]WNO70212.1 ALF repeat-containing protein [Streptomyces sp. AM8-1-1]
MPLHRVHAGIAAGILAPALLLATPSFAAPAAPTAVTVAVSSSADEPSADDLRVAIARILADPDGGRRVTREANALLDANDPDAMRAWLETGYRLAQAEDDRVAIARILADPSISPALRAAANAALDDNTPEALRHFLEVGRYQVD